MSVLSAAEQDGIDAIFAGAAVPRPRAAAPSSAAGGQPTPDGAAGARPHDARWAAAGGRAPGGLELHIRQLRVSELRVSELRVSELRVSEFRAGQRQAAGAGVRPAAGASARPAAGAGARQVRGREVRSLTVRAREVRGREVHGGQVRGGQVRVGEPGRGRPHGAAPRGGETRRGQPRPAGPGMAASGHPAGLRLTRRGRIVLAGLAIAIVTAVASAMLLWLSAAGNAQAAGHGQPPGAAHRGLSRVVVLPGQTLWSIARRAEPSADPRVVVQQIIEVNALGSPVIQPGELLWVPKG